MTMTRSGIHWVADPWGYETAPVLAEVVVTDREAPVLLGPDGRPIRRAPQPFGFDLRPRQEGAT